MPMRRAFALVLFLLAASSLGAAGALAQTPPPVRPPTPAGQPPKPNAQPAKVGDCALLPGGKAPVAQIADLTTPLSPRSLDAVYFGKRLADLSRADFDHIAELSQRCGPADGILNADKVAKLQEVVGEAQRARNETVTWAKAQVAEVEALPPGRERLVRLNDLWAELPSHEGGMTREDMNNFAAWIAREQQALYDATLPPRRPARATTGQAPTGQAAAAAPVAGAAPPAAAPPPAGRPRQKGGEEE
jgi:hypothetical protein